jgi:hypothetical protein
MEYRAIESSYPSLFTYFCRQKRKFNFDVILSCVNCLKPFLFSGAASLAALYRDRLKERGRGRPLPQQCAEGRPNQLVGGEELMGGAEPSLPAHLVGLGLSCCQAPASLGQIWDPHKSVGAGLWIRNDLFRIRLRIRL